MGGGKAAVVLVAAILACWPVSVAGVATVDHPAVDGVDSFDSGPRDSGAVALTFDADLSPNMLRQLQSGRVSSWYNREVREILDLRFETVSRLLKLGAAAPSAGSLERSPLVPDGIGVLEWRTGGRLELSPAGAVLAHVPSGPWRPGWFPRRPTRSSAWGEDLRHWPPPARSGAGVGWTGR